MIFIDMSLAATVEW